MAAMPSPDVPDRKLTYEDYRALPEDGLRYEVLDGVLYVSPAPSIRHQELVRDITLALHLHCRARDLGQVLPAPVDTHLGTHDVAQPDVLFVAAENLDRFTEAKLEGAPDLAVEVLSSDKRRDVVLKRARYQAAKIPEYWLVDPEIESVEVLRLDAAGVYQTAQRLAMHTGGGVLESPLLPGLRLDLAQLFQG